MVVCHLADSDILTKVVLKDCPTVIYFKQIASEHAPNIKLQSAAIAAHANIALTFKELSFCHRKSMHHAVSQGLKGKIHCTNAVS